MYPHVMEIKCMQYFPVVLKWAISMGYIVENPMTAVKRPKIPQKQPLFFSEVDFSMFLRAVDKPDFKDLILFAVYTGLRSGELIALNWEQIDFKNRILTLDNRTVVTKGKKVRTIPLNTFTFEYSNYRLNLKHIGDEEFLVRYYLIFLHF